VRSSSAGPVRPFLEQQGKDRDWPPDISRSLYVLVNHAHVVSADPLGLLNKQLQADRRALRLSDAKLLTKESACLKGVPTTAVDRFLELVAHHEVPPGQCALCLINFVVALRKS
jgi:hypothetical protein